jgi:hypothetical protein
VASERRVAKLEAPSEPEPRRVARPTAAAAAAPPALRPLDGSRSRRDDAVSPPVDAADLPPLDEPPSAPGSRQAVLPSAPPRSLSTGGPMPLVTAAPEPGAGGSVQPGSTGPTSAPNTSECVPYAADSSISGRSEPVQGLACRDAGGRWRRITEELRSN